MQYFRCLCISLILGSIFLIIFSCGVERNLTLSDQDSQTINALDIDRTQFADKAFRRKWEYADGPVQDELVARSSTTGSWSQCSFCQLVVSCRRWPRYFATVDCIDKSFLSLSFVSHFQTSSAAMGRA